MPDPAADAAAQLRAIRSLMERATVYRAISAPAALAAGSFASLVAALQLASPPSDAGFLGAWLAVLVAAAAVNFRLLASGARARNEPFVSAGMKHALYAMLPPLICGLAVSLIHPGCREWHGDYAGKAPAGEASAWMAAMWVMFYGLGLWAARSFSPASMKYLAGAFLLSGLALAVLIAIGRSGGGIAYSALQPAGTSSPSGGAVTTAGPWIMLITFGLFHIIYGLLVLSRRVPHSPPPAE